MKSIIFDHYGPAEELKFGEVPKPAPGRGEVLVRIRAAAVNAADWHVMKADPWPARLMCGLFKPKCSSLGLDLAGEVEALGEGVSGFKAGDRVFACMKFPNIGSFAEYACVAADLVEFMPSNMGFEEAAAVPLAAGTALQALQAGGGLKPGMKVLINGASGGVGCFAVQIAKYRGAHVTAVCSSRNMGQAKELGADLVIDYSKEDFTKSGERYDFILAANGYHQLSAYKNSLAPGGTYSMVGGAGKQMAEAIFLGPIQALGSGKKLVAASHAPRREDLAALKAMIEAGRLKAPIERRFSLEQVPEAIKHVEAGHAQGKVVVVI